MDHTPVVLDGVAAFAGVLPEHAYNRSVEGVVASHFRDFVAFKEYRRFFFWDHIKKGHRCRNRLQAHSPFAARVLAP